MPQIVLQELLRREVEEKQQADLILDLFGKKITFEMLLESLEIQTLKQLASRMNALQDVAKEFIPIKKMLLESHSWLEMLLALYQQYFPEEPLSAAALEHYQRLLEQLNMLMERLDAHLPFMLELYRNKRPSDLCSSARKAFHTIATILNQGLTKNRSDVQEQLEQFLHKTKQDLERIAQYAGEHINGWEKKVLREGRGLYIQTEGLFPLVYSTKGYLYIVMEILGAYLGSGAAKIISRTVDLKTGELFALIRPRTLFQEKETEEQFKKTNFWDTWRETDFLLELQGKKGILQVNDRLVFLREGNQDLFVFETFYPDGSLEDYLRRKDLSLSLATRGGIARDLLEGLCAIHEKKIIHHDIKSDNILLSLTPGKETGVITDFNLACVSDDTLLKDHARLVPHWGAPEYVRVLMNPDYQPEELYPVATFKMDIWALGLVLYCLLNHTYPPWNKLNKEEVMHAVSSLQEGWVPHHKESERFYPLLEKMLEIDPMKRCTALEALVLCQALAPF